MAFVEMFKGFTWQKSLTFTFLGYDEELRIGEAELRGRQEAEKSGKGTQAHLTHGAHRPMRLQANPAVQIISWMNEDSIIPW